MPRRRRKVKKRSQPGGTPPPGRLRIVAGIWRSRALEVADVPGLRPTAERIRETLFNWLAPRIAGARCLDLYAGTGALGLEALSRGAQHAVFVERAPAAARQLRDNIVSLGADGAALVEDDALRYLDGFDGEPFDVVFLDPPFADEKLAELCRLIDERGILAPGGTVYIEQDRRHALPAMPEGWVARKQKEAGNVRYALVEPAGS